MRTQALPLGLFLFTPLLACESNHHTETIEIEVGTIDKVVIDSGAGDVAVYGADCDTVEVFASLKEGDDLDYEVDGNVLRIDPDCSGFFGCGADFIVTVPYHFSADVSTGAGDVKVADLTGSVWVDTGAGDVELDRLGCTTLDVDTGAGDIEASGLTVSDAILDAGAGDIEARWSTKPDDVLVDTGAGDVDLWLPRGSYDIDIDTGAGDSDVDGLSDDSSAISRIRISTGAGDVDLRGY